MKKKILLFIIIFSIGIIVTYPAFASSHALDSYLTIYNGFKETGDLFLQDGRLFSAILMYFYDLINLPFDSMNFVTLFFLNIFLALAILKLYLFFSKYKAGKVMQIILFISTFLLFYTPLISDILILDDAMIYALGILFAVLAALFVQKNSFINYLFSFILLFLSVLCHPMILSYFFIILLLLLMSDECGFKYLLKKIGIGFLIYIFVLIFHKIIFSYNLIYAVNVDKIFVDILPNILNGLWGFIDFKYYLISIILLVCFIYLFIKNDNKGKIFGLFCFMLIFLLLMPFLLSLFIDTDIEARMFLTFSLFPSFLVFLILFNYKIDIKFQYVIFFIMGIWLFLSFYSIHQNMMINFKRFKEDVSYINNVNQRIGWYEAEEEIEVKTVYYAKDEKVDDYYDFGNYNSTSVRLLAVDKVFERAFDVYTNNEYKIKAMSKEDYDKYFKGKNYNKFNKKQLVFDDDVLYLLLY